MLSEQTAALGTGWESMNVQLDRAEPQVERGSQEEGPWRTAPGPLEHLCCDLEEEPQSLQEKGESPEGVCGKHNAENNLLISIEKVELKISKWPWSE